MCGSSKEMSSVDWKFCSRALLISCVHTVFQRAVMSFGVCVIASSCVEAGGCLSRACWLTKVRCGDFGVRRVGFRKLLLFLGIHSSCGCDAARLALRSHSSLEKSLKKMGVVMCPCTAIANAWAWNNVNMQERVFHPCRGRDKIVQN